MGNTNIELVRNSLKKYEDSLVLHAFKALKFRVFYSQTKHTQLAITYSKLTIEVLEQGVKYVQS